MAPRSVLKQRSEHRAGVHECCILTGIRSEPGSGEEIKNIVPGERIGLTAVTDVSESGHVYAQIESGGWILLENDGAAIVKPVISEDDAATTDALPQQNTSPNIRASIRKSFNAPASPTSPASSGKYLPSKTTDQIERGRHASISGGVGRSRSPSIENSRRKSSINIIANDDVENGQILLAGDSSRLAARLGEKSYIENCTRDVQSQVDKLSALMEQHLLFRQQQDFNSVRTVRFGSGLDKDTVF